MHEDRYEQGTGAGADPDVRNDPFGVATGGWLVTGNVCLGVRLTDQVPASVPGAEDGERVLTGETGAPATTAVQAQARDEKLNQEAKFLLEIIRYKAWKLRRAGLEPKRVYMSTRTKMRLERGIYHGGAVVVVPNGRDRVPTVCGLTIHECNDLLDGFVDVAGDDEY